MAIVELQIRGGHRPCSLRLDLDLALPNEVIIVNHIFRGLFYEPETSRAFTRILREGDTVVDVGGNCGYFTVLAAALVGPSGRVITFEPDPANVVRLRNNVAINGFTNVTVIEQPALDGVRPVSFYVNSSNSGGSALWDANQSYGDGAAAAPPPMALTGTTIDAEMARLGITAVKLIKTDIEGADHMALQGARQLLASGKAPFVLCEFHEFALTKMGSGQAPFREFMAGLGYDTFALMFNGTLPMMVPGGTRMTSQFVCNLLFTTAAAISEFWPLYDYQGGDLYCDPGDVVVTHSGFVTG